MSPHEWLLSAKNRWPDAVNEAADNLLKPYYIQFPTRIPTDLECVASTLQARIERVGEIQGGARLIPVPGGFRIVVGDAFRSARFRSAVAHELAHTLFYSRETRIPHRLVERSKREESFCFDVARRVLAPFWMLERAGITNCGDVHRVFNVLTELFGLSRPVAARLILADYTMFIGVAGRWTKSRGVWKFHANSAAASPSLSPNDRKRLHSLVRHWLQNGATPETKGLVPDYSEINGSTAFVLIQSHTSMSYTPPSSSYGFDNATDPQWLFPS